MARDNPQAVPVLGLTVGLSQEKLKNALKQHIGTAGWVTAARERPGEIIAMLDSQFGLVESLKAQLGRTYSFGDVLVARAGTRVTAVSASASGRVLEIDGMYTVSTLDRFKADLEYAARFKKLI